MFTDRQIKELDAKLNSSTVKERSEGGRRFSYVEGWHVIAEANRIFGFGSWSSSVIATECVVSTYQGEPNYQGSNNRAGYLVAYTAHVDVSVHIDGATQHHSDVGYGEGINYSNVGQAHESAIKEAVTDAEKRALRHWGNVFGLALYDKERTNVEQGAPATRSGNAAPPPQQKPQGGKNPTYYCEEHSKFWVKTGNMKSYGHPIEGSRDWCHMSASNPGQRSSKERQMQERDEKNQAAMNLIPPKANLEGH